MYEVDTDELVGMFTPAQVNMVLINCGLEPKFVGTCNVSTSLLCRIIHHEQAHRIAKTPTITVPQQRRVA